MEKIKYQYYSGHHLNIERLHQSITNYRYATVLDKFAFYSINSNFTLPNQEKPDGWFCIQYKDIAQLTGYKERTIKGIVKLLTNLGLIEKVRKIIKNKCRACLRVTHKTLAILGLTKHIASSEKKSASVPTVSNSAAKGQRARKNLTQEGTFKSAENAPAYNEYREKEKDINNITCVTRTGSQKQESLYNIPSAVKEVFNRIGGRLQKPEKASIWGAICNLQKQHNKQISSLSEYVGWVSFSIINSEYQLKNALSFRHRLNLIMAIARSSQGFKKPRGFHNHWDIGQELRVLKQEPTTNDKKENKIWSEEKKSTQMKSQRAALIVDINTAINDNKKLELLFSNNSTLKLKQKTVNDERIAKAKKALKLIDKKSSYIP